MDNLARKRTLKIATEFLELRSLRGGHFGELQQDVERPHQLNFTIDGDSAFSVAGSTENGAMFEVCDPDGLRKMGEELIALADRAEACGMFDALRQHVSMEGCKAKLRPPKRQNLSRIVHEMWRSLDARVSDDSVKTAIREDWLRITL